MIIYYITFLYTIFIVTAICICMSMFMRIVNHERMCLGINKILFLSILW